MPSPPTSHSQEPVESPFFPPPSTTRPSLDSTGEVNSDSSIDTLSSISSALTSSSYSSSEMPYSRLVRVESSQIGGGGTWDVGSELGENGGSQSQPSSRAGSLVPSNKDRPQHAEEIVEYPTSFVAPSSSLGSNSNSQRHQSLPTLITSQPTPKANTTGIRSSAPPPPPATTYTMEQALSLTPDHSPALTSAPSFSSSPQPFFSSSSFRAPPISSTAQMTRSHSSTPSLSRLPSPTSHRPGSSGTFSSTASSAASSTSTRPWVRDSDASSVCSGGSCWSEKGANGGEMGLEDGGEVLKVAGEGVEFLDPRPEPKGASLSIDRTSPTVVVLHVTLPGFSLDNITVAMRRGHKVHIVADSYGAEGGHFEKLVSLGSGVSSAAPRAEFDGACLKVYVQRRVGRSATASSMTSSSGDATSPPVSPPFTASSPSSSSIDSLSLTGHPNSSNTSPSIPPASTFVSSASEPPIVTRSTADGPSLTGGLHQKKSSKSLTGPEGAKAAAKKAREEAAMRAREEAKALPKVGRRVVLSRDGGVRGGGGAPLFGSARKEQEEERSLAEPLAVPPERNGTIKARSSSPAAVSPSSASTHESTSSNSSSDDSLTSNRSPTDSLTSLEPSPPSTSSTSPSRPKFRPSNLTLRPGDRTSFREASLAGESSPGAISEGKSEGGGSATPKVERGESTWGFSVPGTTATTPKAGRRSSGTEGGGGIGEAL